MNMEYYIIDGKTGNILRSTDDNSGYLSVWETISGGTQDYWTYVKLPEEMEDQSNGTTQQSRNNYNFNTVDIDSSRSILYIVNDPVNIYNCYKEEINYV